jgi:hypothetical protein
MRFEHSLYGHFHPGISRNIIPEDEMTSPRSPQLPYRRGLGTLKWNEPVLLQAARLCVHSAVQSPLRQVRRHTLSQPIQKFGRVGRAPC